jgi:hypothetical protein
MEIDTFALRLVIHPLTLVDITVSVNESTHTICHVIFPIALVEGSIFPELFSPSVPNTIVPLSNINVSILQLDCRLPFIGKMSLVVERSEFLCGFPYNFIA